MTDMIMQRRKYLTLKSVISLKIMLGGYTDKYITQNKVIFGVCVGNNTRITFPKIPDSIQIPKPFTERHSSYINTPIYLYMFKITSIPLWICNTYYNEIIDKHILFQD